MYLLAGGIRRHSFLFFCERHIWSADTGYHQGIKDHFFSALVISYFCNYLYSCVTSNPFIVTPVFVNKYREKTKMGKFQVCLMLHKIPQLIRIFTWLITFFFEKWKSSQSYSRYSFLAWMSTTFSYHAIKFHPKKIKQRGDLLTSVSMNNSHNLLHTLNPLFCLPSINEKPFLFFSLATFLFYPLMK